MKCPNCNSEMATGYALYPGFLGEFRIVKTEVSQKNAVPQVALCPKCGKLELYLPPEKISYIQEL